MIKTSIILLDRDGTLLYDRKYHLGRTSDWRSKVKLLPYVVRGIQQLRAIPHAKLYMITNQPGVAAEAFPLLTLQRAHEVCRYILKTLRKKGAKLDGYFLCPHASPSYARKHSSLKISEVCNCSCIKPRLGMVFSALRAVGVKRSAVVLYVIGDRASDVRTAINARGTGILVPFENEPGQVEKARRIKGNVYIAKNFLDAVAYVRKR
jgi:histidinol-phosphate phosphatase family protein